MTSRFARTRKAIVATLCAAFIALAATLTIAFDLPPWCFLLAIFVAVAIASRVQRPGDDLRDDDPLAPWRAFRTVQCLTLVAHEREDVSLEVTLTREWDLEGDVARLRFDGIRRLEVEQLYGPQLLQVDCLVCQDRSPQHGDERYSVRDRWGEVLRFRCRSFEKVEGTRA